jgi:hypothetical protein
MSAARRLLICLVFAGACGGDDDGGADDDGGNDGGNDGGSGAEEWQVVSDGLPAALLSVWGSSESDVWAVGGEAGDGAGPAVFHWDGSAWTRMDTGITDNTDLWWVFGFEGGPIFFGGEKGTILRYEGGEFEQLTTPGVQTVFGMWGASPDDVWAVGGNLTGGGFAWRFDGTEWTEVAEVPEEITGPGTIWKVAGRDANDVWMSATGGITLHWNGELLVENIEGTDVSLFSVSGNDERFITVGGDFDGIIYENEGEGWIPALEPGESELLSGVVVRDDAAYAVGRFGTILQRESDGWVADDGGGLTQENLHAAWIDPVGGVWVVGGQFDAPMTSAGVLLHKGNPIQGTLP